MTVEDATRMPTDAVKGATDGLREWRRKFDSIPVAMYEEDYSRVAAAVADLRESGITDLGEHFTQTPDDLDRLIRLIEVTAANPRAVRLVGAEDESQLLGTIPAEILDDATYASFVKQFQAIMDGDDHVAIELEGQQFGGRHIDCLMNWAVPRSTTGPDYAHVQIAFLDITARRAAENLATESAAKLAQLYEIGVAMNSSLDESEVLQMIANGVLSLVGADTSLVFVVDHENRQVTHRLFAGTHGGPWADQDYAELESGISGHVWRKGAGTSSSDIVSDARNTGTALARAEDNGAWSIIVSPLFAEDEVVGTLTASRRPGAGAPLGESEQIYVEMLCSLASIAFTNARLYSGLRDTMATLQLTQSSLLQAQKLEAVGQLAAGVAHEINTPVQFVSDNMVFLRDTTQDILSVFDAAANLATTVRAAEPTEDALDGFETAVKEADLEFLREEVPQAIVQSLEGVGRVSAIVRALKEFSHPGTDSLAPVDVNRAIENTVTVARNEWKYVAEVTTELEADVGTVPALSGPLNQVFLNLLVNAAHAIGDVVGDSGELGTITIVSQRRDPWVEIRISDTGTGISEDVQERIFDPFFTTKEVGKGTGQGLAIAADVVIHKHGGQLTVESEIGSGTTFIIRLPIEATEQVGEA